MPVSVYERRPEYSTESFDLRLVGRADARSLLRCYSSPRSAARMNADRCTSDFYYRTESEMLACIDYWLEEYARGDFLRLAVLPRGANESDGTSGAVGTIELFGGENPERLAGGVLRVDLAPEYDTPEAFAEMLLLAVTELVRDLNVGTLYVRSANVPDRVPVLESFGYAPSKDFRPEAGYHERRRTARFDASKGLAFCGLACCVCGESDNCAGCRSGQCADREWCRGYACQSAGRAAGCGSCGEFPCGFDMLKKPRVKAFAELAAELGEERMLSALRRNESDGIIYHYPGSLVGDYDKLPPDKIKELVRRGLYAEEAL